MSASRKKRSRLPLQSIERRAIGVPFDNKRLILVCSLINGSSSAMKKLLKYILFFLCFSPFCHTENPTLLIPQSSLIDTNLPLGEEDEVKIIDQLITATTAQLETEKHLKELMLQFKKQREDFIQGNQTKTHAGRMVRTARQIYETIAANHLEHLFAKDYLDELTFFSSIAGKTAVTRP